MVSGVNESSTADAPSLLSKRSWLIALYLVALVASAIVAPMCFLGNASGHDFQPHVASWIEVAGQWREGIIYPRWAAGANFAFGEPRFVFYPPLSWMLGAALGSLLPWKIVPGVFVWLSIVIAGGSMWRLAREWLSPTQAIAAALFFAANPYHLALIYYRSDFAELLASALFPVIVWAVFGVLNTGWRRVPVLALIFAGIWLSNAPAAVIATYSLTLLLVVGCIVARSVRNLILGALSMLAGFGLAGFYLVPAWWEQRWVQISGVVSTTYNPESNFLFTRANDPSFIQFNWKISAVAAVILVFTSIGIALSFGQRRDYPRQWWALAALSIAGTGLMLPPSVFLWRHLPELRFLQFPWRWLLVLGFTSAFFAAAAGVRTWRFVWWLTFAIAIGASGVTIAGDTFWDSEDVPAAVEGIRAGHGYEGIEGFQPRNAKVDELDDESELIGEVDPESGDIDTPEKSQIDIKKWAVESKVFDAKSDENVTLALRLLNYPAWKVQVDGTNVTGDTDPRTGQLVVPLSAGFHHVEIHFRRTSDRTVGILISVASVMGLLIPPSFLISASFRGRRSRRRLRTSPSRVAD